MWCQFECSSTRSTKVLYGACMVLMVLILFFEQKTGRYIGSVHDEDLPLFHCYPAALLKLSQEAIRAVCIESSLNLSSIPFHLLLHVCPELSLSESGVAFLRSAA